MTHLSRGLVFCIVLSFILAPLSFVNAQGGPASLDDHPLMEMLALVPNTDLIRVGTINDPASLMPYITFVNYRAVLEADPDFPYPADYADYAAQVERGREAWKVAPFRIASEPTLPLLWQGTGAERDPVTLNRTGPLVGEVMETLTGMDYFDIHTGMTLGRPPTHGMIFGGDLDLDAIGAAHMARDYAENSVQGLRVWCSGKAGCEGGNETDGPESIEFYNVFDNRIGRQPPFLGAEGSSANYIAGAFDYDLLLAMVDSAADASDSLADAEDYRTLASALIDPERYTGDLLQAHLFPGHMTSAPANLTTWALAMGASGLDEWVAPADWADYGTLPAYQLMALADRQEGDEVVTMVALLYPDAAEAEAALPELTARLTTYASALEWRTNEPVLSSRPANPSIQDSYVHIDAETGWAAAVVTLRNDFSFVSDGSGETVSNYNVLYPLYAQDILSQAFYPLWTADFSNWQAWEN